MILLIGNLSAYGGGVKQLHVMRVCLNKSALDTDFKGCGIHQTHDSRHISGNKLQPLYTEEIQDQIKYQSNKRNAGQQDHSLGSGHSALFVHYGKHGQGTEEQP